MEKLCLKVLIPTASKSLKRAFTFIIVSFAVFCPFKAESHPHVFITSNIGVEFSSKGPIGIVINWSFDEFFSAMIAGDYDRNKDGVFDKNESNAIYNGAFKNLKNFNYFTAIKINSRNYIINKVTRFRATLNSMKMKYSFFIPVRKDAREIIFSQYDSSYYTDVYLKGKVKNKSKNFLIKSTLYKNIDKSFYNGMVHPYEIKIDIRRKK